jgi:hypothetical protein
MPHVKEAFDSIDRNTNLIKSLVNNPKTFLYIGWRSDCKPWWYDKFCKDLGINDITVIEIFEPNYRDLVNNVKSGRYDVKTIFGDATKLANYTRTDLFKDNSFDIVYWDHGPEHINLNELESATNNLMSITNKMLLYSCPWGVWEQGADGGNVNEEHKAHLTEDDLLKLDMNVITVGGPGQANKGELIAFKFNKNLNVKFDLWDWK